MSWTKIGKGGSGGGSGGGGIPNPEAGVLSNNEMLKANVGGTEIVGTGDTNTATEVTFSNKDLYAKTGNFDAGTIDLVGLSISERGGYLQTVSAVTGRTFISLDYQVADAGTSAPLYDSRATKVVRRLEQSDDSQTMIGVTGYTVIPTTSDDVSRVYIKLVNPITNFRARVTSDTTGKVVTYIPSRSDFNTGVGLDFVAGEQFFDLETVLPELAGFNLTIEVFADQSIDVLGDGVNPWRAVDSQLITSYRMLDETDIGTYAREFFISNDAGDDNNDGLTLTSPKKTINDAIAAANALIPPPSVTDRVAITDLGSSTYTSASDFILSNGMFLNVPASAIKGDDGVAVEINSDAALQVARLTCGDTAGSTAVRMAGSGCTLKANTIRVGDVGNTQNGVRVVGQNADINVDTIISSNSESILLLLDGTANSAQPIVVDRFIMDSFLNTAIKVDTSETEAISFNVGLIRDGGNSDCLGLDVRSGNVKINITEMAADVNIKGSSTVAMNITRMEDTNTITVEVGATLNIWCIEGNPTIVNNGVINGYIGGVYYGDAINSHYVNISVDTLVPNSTHSIYVDPTLNEVTVTLATEPVDGENKTVWLKNNDNPVNFKSESPSFPVAPPTQIAPGNLQAQWILDGDSLDAFDFGRDLTNQGSGGSFVPITINGNLVNGFDFEQTAYLEATVTSYKGVLGSSARSFTTWYVANSGVPTTTEVVASWGSDNASGGRWWLLQFNGATSEIRVDVKNSWRTYDFASVPNLFDGNPHHIGVSFTGPNVTNAILRVDNVVVPVKAQDTVPNMNTTSEFNFKLGAGLTAGASLDGILYDSRLWDRGLSGEENLQVMNQQLSGGQTITGAPDNFLFDMTYNGAAWVFGDGLPLFVQENRARIIALEASQVDVIEDYPTNEVNPNLKLAPDTLGGVEWVIDPLGVTFDSDLVLDGSEVTNRFVYTGTGNVNITLAPSASTTLDYTIFIENKGEANGTITILLDGSDTLSGGSALAIGDVSTVTKTTATNYNSDLVTPATTSTINNLEDSNINLGAGSSAAFPAANNVEDALVLISVDALFGVSTDATLTGDGTVGDPLSVESTLLPKLTYTTNANIDGLDVTTLAPVGILFIDLPQNREIRSLTGGVDGQIVKIVNLTTFNFKAKHEAGTFQMIRCEGETDKTAGGYGGFELVYNAATGYWYDINHQ